MNKTGLTEKDGGLLLNGQPTGGKGTGDAQGTTFDNNGTGLNSTDVQSAIEEVNTKVDNIASIDADTTNYAALFGQTMATYYPDECRMIKNSFDKYVSPSSIRFIHVSDNHGANHELAAELLDCEGCHADFLADTGDLILVTLKTESQITEDDVLVTDVDGNPVITNGKLTVNSYIPIFSNTTKPSFVSLGNHDVCDSSDSVEYLWQRYNKFIASNAHINGTKTTQGFVVNKFDGKTYYSVDITKNGNSGTYKFKLIFLDPTDGLDAFPSMPYAEYNVSPSDDQIAWFIGELNQASITGATVVCFTHVAPGIPARQYQEKGWCDSITETGSSLNGFCDIVDAFINGGTKTTEFNDDVTHYNSNGNAVLDTYTLGYRRSYTVGFHRRGIFAGWFCGHLHGDSYGWIEGHDKQYQCTIDRYHPTYQHSVVITENQDGSKYKTGNFINYVKVNVDGRVDVMRLGNNELHNGQKRESFSYNAYQAGQELLDMSQWKSLVINKYVPQFVPSHDEVLFGDKVRIYFGYGSDVGESTFSLHYKVNDGEEQVTYSSPLELTVTSGTTKIEAWFKQSDQDDGAHVTRMFSVKPRVLKNSAFSSTLRINFSNTETETYTLHYKIVESSSSSLEPDWDNVEEKPSITSAPALITLTKPSSGRLYSYVKAWFVVDKNIGGSTETYIGDSIIERHATQ